MAAKTGVYPVFENKFKMPFPAYQRLFELVMNAVTGQEDEPDKARFQTEKG